MEFRFLLSCLYFAAFVRTLVLVQYICIDTEQQAFKELPRIQIITPPVPTTPRKYALPKVSPLPKDAKNPSENMLYQI